MNHKVTHKYLSRREINPSHPNIENFFIILHNCSGYFVKKRKQIYQNNTINWMYSLAIHKLFA